MRRVVAVGLVGLGLLVGPSAAPAAAIDDAGWTYDQQPIDPAQQTQLGFCDRSHWIQPWRGYLDTWPVARLRRALGVNVNVPASQLKPVSTILQDAGFRRGRIEFGWDTMSFDHPDRLEHPARIRRALRILRAHQLRPLLLLNANSGSPGPQRRGHVQLALPALPGARTLEVTPASVAAITPGYTGLRTGDLQNGVLFTAVNGTTVTLSRPLPELVTAGDHEVATWRYLPFGQSDSPRFQETLAGWQAYVRALTRTARSVLGDHFDVEVWNELSFGSGFLSATNYYRPLPPDFGGTGPVDDALLAATVATVRADPANAGVGITDGFASQTPFAAPSTLPAGLTAMSKHPYSGPRRVFGQRQKETCRPLDATGQPSGTPFEGGWLDAFTPSYVDYFPEYYLTAIQTEHLIRDVSPLTTDVQGTPHGRAVPGPDGRPVQTWVTETNMDPSLAALPGPVARHMQAKSLLRTLVSFVSKGISVVDFYAASGDGFGIIDGHGRGETIEAVTRLTGHLGRGRIRHRRRLSLLAVGDRDGGVQFEGDGSAQHPALSNRSVLAAFPFQVSDRRFVVPAYVMTRDVAKDLPAAPFRLVLGGLRGRDVRASAYDPATDRAVPVEVVARTAGSVTLELPLSDSVRLIALREPAKRRGRAAHR